MKRISMDDWTITAGLQQVKRATPLEEDSRPTFSTRAGAAADPAFLDKKKKRRL